MASRARKDVSVASFFDLKAELAKQEEESARHKAAGTARGYVVGGIKRPDKKPTVWQRQNKGVAARAQRDAEMGVAQPVLEDAMEKLTKKAALYDKLRKGKSGGLDEKQYDTLLVDFDLKAEEHGFSTDSEDEDESRTVPRRPDDDQLDPIVEYQDEFGRTRTARRSELPRHLAHESEPSELPADDDPYLLRGGDHNFFPTYQQSDEKIAAIKESLIEERPNKHYDASAEVRAKGAAFYQFSQDAEERKQQMDDLKKARDETVQVRRDDDDEEAVVPKGIEKRKREIEERRRAIEAKRRKLDHTSSTNKEERPSTSLDPFAALEAAGTRAVAVAPDPFAVLEGKLSSTSKTTDADAFLASLGLKEHNS